MKTLAQRKLDAKNTGWPWPIDHPNDERALMNGCYPDVAAAVRVKEFFEELLVLPKEGGGTRPFVLLDWWYRDAIAPIFGWKKADGRRRFDKAFISTAKKTGKSTVLAGLPLYMMLADGEEEAEAYAAAVDRDQASIIYRKTSRAVKDSTHLSSVCKRVDSQKRIVHPASSSFFEAISSDADSTEGKNPHLLLCDEVHVWKNRQFFDALMYGDISRSQPLMLLITTAGSEIHSIGFEEYEFAKDLHNPNSEFYSQSHYAFIAEADPDLAWDDPIGWQQGNPSLAEGIGSLDKLHAKCEEARQTPRKQRSFERYICNRWVTDVDDPWLDEDMWKACGGAVPSHEGDAAFGGLDLSKSVDLTALCLAFWGHNGAEECIDLRWWFWMPENRLKEKEDRDRVPYRDWVRDGWIEATPGNIVDYAYIRRTISGVTAGEPVEDCLNNRHDIREIAFDKWGSEKLVTELGEYDGIEMAGFGQGYADMSSPSNELERRIAQGLIRHGGNPVAAWMARNAVTDEDPAGNIKPTKKRSRNKIDGIVAAIMALGRLIKGESQVLNYYEDNPVEVG